MKIISNAKLFQKTLERERRKGCRVGFVATMGALHQGHLALVRAAQKQNSVTAVSIFVNPAQFGPNEDFKKYPRALRQDIALLRQAGVDYLFCPSVEEIYPGETALSVQIDPEASFVRNLCGRFRPGHFEGVATVVAKLFVLTGACRAYFGAKDFQQTVVIKRLVRDMLFPVEVVVLSTVRETDGLALSSRNRYLSASDRICALKIPQVLGALKHSLSSVPTAKLNLELLKKQAVRNLEQAGLRVQYFEIVDPETLLPLKSRQDEMLAAVACFAGKTRLIDNVILCSPRQRSRAKNKKRKK